MSEAKFNAPEGATHYMENTEDWLFTWFKKDENGKWLGRTDDMDCWDDNCGYEDALILPIPRKNMHEAAPEMYENLAGIIDMKDNVKCTLVDDCLIAAAPDNYHANISAMALLERLGLESSDEYQQLSSATAKARGE